jgi:hypothetical protein
MIGGELYQSDKELGIDRDIYNFTESTIVMPNLNISEMHPIQKTKGIINEGRLYKIVDSGINFLLVSTEQVTKMGIEYGYQNPEIDFKLIWKYLVYILIIVIILMLLRPLGYLIVFLVMLVIMIKDRKRKRLNKLNKNTEGD